MNHLYKINILLFVIFGSYCAVFAQDKADVIKSLSQKADIIITGKVTEKKSDWNKEKTRIYTTVQLEVEEELKGEIKINSVKVSYPGGEVEDVGELYSHMPRFVNNEQVLVFLKKDNIGSGYRVLNGESGKITLIEKDGQKMTNSNVSLNSLRSKIKKYQNIK